MPLVYKTPVLNVPISVISFFLPEAPVDGDVVIQQHVRQAPFGAVLRDDTDVRHLNRTADKFAEIGMVQLPEDKNGY